MLVTKDVLPCAGHCLTTTPNSLFHHAVWMTFVIVNPLIYN